MFKKLDLLILRAFIGPFIGTFLVAEFVLVLQFFWLYIDDLVGKGLETLIIAKLIMYVAATTVPMALPLAILLSSIMTFGNLGESFELVAIKSAGISLRRFMQPLLIVSFFVAGIAFLFANNIIPVANLKLNTLKYDIIFSKPAFDIKEGVFYDKIDGYVIKLGRKDPDGNGIYNIVIYERGPAVQDNLIVADSGVMRMSKDKRNLEFNLRNGTRYEEKGMRNVLNTEFYRIGFKEYNKTLDLSSFMKIKTNDSAFKDNYKMLTLKQLNVFIDSIKKQQQQSLQRLQNGANIYLKFSKFFDSGYIKKSVPYKGKAIKNMQAILPDSAWNTVFDLAVSNTQNIKGNMDVLYSEYNDKYKSLRYHNIEWHRKFALSAACVVLFLIGAPLGSIIRKGGIGLPLVFAIVFFMIFFMLSTMGEKFVKEDVTTAFGGMWMSTFILIPVGLFLTYKAMGDSQLFNKEYYYRAIKKIRAKLPAKNKNKPTIA